MIEKPAILVTSVGRTGTEFFAKFFAAIIPDCTSLHEPDIFKFAGVDNEKKNYADQVRQVGLWRLIFLKALGKWTLVNLSDGRFRGALDYQRAVDQLHAQRSGFVQHLPGSIYVESNLGYYGLLDVMPAVFSSYRAVYIVRDGRDWVRSMINWGEVYAKTGLRSFFAHKWPTAKNTPGDPLAEDWDHMPLFDQLCWAWARLNEFALNQLHQNGSARLFHFEKIFTGDERYRYLDDLIAFATSLPGLGTLQTGSTQGWLERKIHQSTDGFPTWKEWTPEQLRRFNELCGPVMERLGYRCD